jgi:nucleotidyltransferase substrate binding protein (TIGR01987 family)
MVDNLTRCKQRFENYTSSLKHLSTAVDIDDLNDIEKAGLIQFFEVTFELAWKLMKDYLQAQGYDNIKSPRDSIKTAFSYGLIEDGKTWLEALEKRNLTSHTYDSQILDQLKNLIILSYYPLMDDLKKELEKKLWSSPRT